MSEVAPQVQPVDDATRFRWAAQQTQRIVYDRAKAKLFTILESQFDGQKLAALKSMVEDVISQTTHDMLVVLSDFLGSPECFPATPRPVVNQNTD